MSIVHSYSVGNGDMFSIRHNSDNFTIVDCCVSEENKDAIFKLLNEQSKNKGISRFISTHPDQDHIAGLNLLDDELPIYNFYCVNNTAIKEDETEAFKHYCDLRDGEKAFHIYKDCSRRWMNLADEERGTSGIQILWPDTDNEIFKEAMIEASSGNSPNNISPIIKYSIEDGGSYAWFGDLETDFLEKIEDHVEWHEVDIVFAPHHGRGSGKMPPSILEKLNPQIIVIGEAPSENLEYYSAYNTITQNSAGAIAFESLSNRIDIYVGSDTYSVNFLTDYGGTRYDNYIGSIDV